MKKAILFFIGWVSLFLGIAGIILPLLPATPLFLLAAACFFRSSDSIYNWLVNHKLFGKYICSFHRFRAVSRRAKYISITTLWALNLFSIFFLISFIWARISLLVIAASVSVYILRLKTLTAEMEESLNIENS